MQSSLTIQRRPDLSPFIHRAIPLYAARMGGRTSPVLSKALACCFPTPSEAVPLCH